MEENKSCMGNKKSCQNCASVAIPFILGIVIALVFGWWIFPDLMYRKEPQPLAFNHSIHLEKARRNKTDKPGVDCIKCHTFNEDGSFTGIPKLSVCAECHIPDRPLNSAAIEEGKSTQAEIDQYNAEKTLVEEYIKKGKEIPWKVHQEQPDNVFFSHSVHLQKCYKCHLTMKGSYDLGTPENPQKLCLKCHLSINDLSAVPPVEIDIMTGYSKTTMRMSECEKCHAHPGHFTNGGKGRTVANNACSTCHK